MRVYYHGGGGPGGPAKVVPCGLCHKPMYHPVNDPTTPACQACRKRAMPGPAPGSKAAKAQTHGWSLALNPFRAQLLNDPERPSQAPDEAQSDSEPQGTCKDHPGDYGPMCALCDDDRARYRAWRKSHEL